MITVLGCDHCLQLPESMHGFWRDLEQAPRARRQREGFRNTIGELVRDRPCGFIGEETNCAQITPAAQIAARLGVRYQNIEMTSEERTAAGIPAEDYADNPRYSDAQKREWHRIREQHMIEEIEAARGDSENLLIICGIRHMVPLWEYFRERGEDVSQPLDVTQSPWFSGPLQSDWLFEKE